MTAVTEAASQSRRSGLTARRVFLLGPPLAFAIWASVHPKPEVEPQAVMDVATWFAAFHVLQLVLVGLVAISIVLLALDFGVVNAWSTWLGLGLFVIFFSAYDAVAGIATGLAMRAARDLPPEQQAGVWETVKDWPGFDIPVFTLSVIASLGWVVALVGLALAARRSGAALAEWLFILFAGVFLLGGHPAPFGTVAFACLFVAAALHEWARLGATSSSRGAGAPSAASAEHEREREATEEGRHAERQGEHAAGVQRPALRHREVDDRP